MAVTTQTFPQGLAGGMVASVPAQSLPDDCARYLQDILLDQPGYVRRRGPVQNAAGVAQLPAGHKALGLTGTFDPEQVYRAAVFACSGSDIYLDVFSSDFSSVTSHVYEAISTVGTSPLFCSRQTFNAKGAVIGSAFNYWPASQRWLGLWRGADKADCTSGTVTVTQGSTEITGSGTSWAGEATAGMFLFLGSDGYPVGVVSNVNSNTSITLEEPALWSATGSAYKLTALRGLTPRVTTGFLTCAQGDTTINGADTKFVRNNLPFGTWMLYRASDLAFIGQVSSVISDLQLAITAGSPIALDNDAYIAVRKDGDGLTMVENTLGWISEAYANRQWYANATYHSSRVWFSEISGAEDIDLAPDDGNYLDIPGIGDIICIRATAFGLLVMKTNDVYLISGTDPDTFAVQHLLADGCLSAMAVCDWHETVIWPGHLGIYAYDGSSLNTLTDGKLDLYYQQTVYGYNTESYRMWGLIERDHYFLYLENASPPYGIRTSSYHIDESSSSNLQDYLVADAKADTLLSLQDNGSGFTNGQTLPDLSGNGRDWIISASGTVSTGPALLSGDVNSSLRLIYPAYIAAQGSQLTSDIDFSEDFTVQSFFDSRQAGTTTELFVRAGLDASSYGVGLQVKANANGSISLQVTTLTNNVTAYSTAAGVFTIGNVYQWALRYTAATRLCEIFLNDIKVLACIAETTNGGPPPVLLPQIAAGQGNQFQVGGNGAVGTPWLDVAFLSIYYRALTDEEISKNYSFSQQFKLIQSGTNYWTLNESIPTKATILCNLKTAAFSLLTNLHLKGYMAHPSQSGHGSQYLVNDGSGQGYVCDAQDLFNESGRDAITCDGATAGPQFYLETKRYDASDQGRKKLWKMVLLEHEVEGDTLTLETIPSLDAAGIVSSSTFSETTGDFLMQRIKFLKRGQVLGIRLYETAKTASRVKLGALALGFKLQRPGRP